MREQLRQAREDQSGFTLIELLIVIVILGVLAGIVVFSVQGITDRGKASACSSDKKTVEVAVEAYYAKKGTYPANVAALTVSPDVFLHSPPSGTWAIDGTTGAVTVTAGTGNC